MNQSSSITNEGTENFDTSAFNDDYSDDSELESSTPRMQFSTQQTMSPTAMETGTTLFKSTTIRAVRPAGRRPLADTSTTSSTQQQQQKMDNVSAAATADDDDDELHDGDDEGEEKPVLPPKNSSTNRTTTDVANTNDADVDEYGFLIQPEHARLKNKSALHR